MCANIYTYGRRSELKSESWIEVVNLPLRYTIHYNNGMINA
jgi:hypothetical protein